MEAIATQTITHCASCSNALGACAPANDSQVVLARCATCERRYYIATPSIPNQNILLGGNAGFGFSPRRHLTSYLPLVERLPTPNSYDVRRKQPRAQDNFPLIAVPLDEDFQPFETAMPASCIDISLGGISFSVCSDRAACYWLVDFSPIGHVGVQRIMYISRMEPDQADCWKIAGPFMQ